MADSEVQQGQALLERRRSSLPPSRSMRPLLPPTRRSSSGGAPMADLEGDLRRVPEGDCPRCLGLGRVRTDAEPGEPGFGQLEPCDCQREALEARRLRELVALSGLLPEELALTLDDVLVRQRATPLLLERARRFVARPWGFFTVWGGYGNGKTLVLQAVVNELRARGLPGAYVKMNDLIDHVRAGFARDAADGARKRYERLRQVPVLAIDEFDTPRMTGFAHEFRSAFLDDRYRLACALRAHTLFAMNMNPADGWLSGDIYDRLRDGRFRPGPDSVVIFRNADASMRPSMVPPAR